MNNEELYLIAGLQPLPIGRMIRQAGRPMTRPASRRPLNRFGRPVLGKGQVPTPKGAAEETIRRIQRMNEVIENHKPLDEQWKEWMNRNRENKRSRTLAPDIQQLDGPFNEFVKDSFRLKNTAFNEITDYSLPGAEFKAEQNEVEALRKSQRLTDFAMLDGDRFSSLKNALFEGLDARYNKSLKMDPYAQLDTIGIDTLPASIQYGPGRELGNDLLAEWRSSRARMQRAARAAERAGMAQDVIRTIDTPSSPSQSVNDILFPGI